MDNIEITNLFFLVFTILLIITIVVDSYRKRRKKGKLAVNPDGSFTVTITKNSYNYHPFEYDAEFEVWMFLINDNKNGFIEPRIMIKELGNDTHTMTATAYPLRYISIEEAVKDFKSKNHEQI